MANNVIKIKRTAIAGRAANTTTLSNPGELALNMTDGIMYSTNGSVIFEVGANNTNVNITGNATINAIIANGSLGTSGQVLSSNGTGLYWDDVAAGGFSNGQSISVNNFVITGAFTANSSNGSSGQVLASNGTSVYWTNQTGGSPELPTQDTNPGSPSDGTLYWNSALGKLLVYYQDANTSQWVEATPTGALGPIGPTGPSGPKSLTIINPTASEDATLFYTDSQKTLSSISSVLLGTGGSTVTFTIRYAADRSAAGTEAKTGGMICSSTTTSNVVSSFDNPTIPINNFVWLETSSISGSVQEFHVSLTF